MSSGDAAARLMAAGPSCSICGEPASGAIFAGVINSFEEQHSHFDVELIPTARSALCPAHMNLACLTMADFLISSGDEAPKAVKS